MRVLGSPCLVLMTNTYKMRNFRLHQIVLRLWNLWRLFVKVKIYIYISTIFFVQNNLSPHDSKAVSNYKAVNNCTQFFFYSLHQYF